MGHPKVFVSYSHDSETYGERVLSLAERLRADGFEAMVDQYVEGTPPQGWARWMLNQIEGANHVLLLCTEPYYRRFRGLESSGVGRGVDWQGAVITTELYDKKSISSRFVPVLFDAADRDYVPDPLRTFTCHVLTSETAYSALTDYLAGAAGVPPATLGPSPDRQRKTGTSLRFDRRAGAEAVAAQPVPDLAARPAPGGTMPADDVFYVERGVDRSAKAAAARRCETIVVKGPRQFSRQPARAVHSRCPGQTARRLRPWIFRCSRKASSPLVVS